MCRGFCGVMGRTEPYYKTPLFSHKYDKLELTFSSFTPTKSHRSAGDTVPLIAKFEAYCLPKKNVTHERHLLNLRKQKPDELKRLAKNCEYRELTRRTGLSKELTMTVLDQGFFEKKIYS